MSVASQSWTAAQAIAFQDAFTNAIGKNIAILVVLILNQMLMVVVLTGAFFLLKGNFTEATVLLAVFAEVVSLLVICVFCCPGNNQPEDSDSLIQTMAAYAVLGWQTTLIGSVAVIEFYTKDIADPLTSLVALLLAGDACVGLIGILRLALFRFLHGPPFFNITSINEAQTVELPAAFDNPSMVAAPAA